MKTDELERRKVVVRAIGGEIADVFVLCEGKPRRELYAALRLMLHRIESKGG
jgi:hypothetical protein